MMRYRNEHQESLYQQYVSIGRKIEKYSQSKKNNELSHQYGWKLITKKGIWKLPITKDYTGLVLNWEKCFLAIEGLASTFSNFKFYSYLVLQFSTLYLVSKYGSKESRQLYLPRLVNGDISFALYSEEINYVNILPLSENRNFILHDYLNFKRILYSIQAIKITRPIIKKYQAVLRQSMSQLSSPLSITNCEEITNKIESSYKKLCSSLNNF